MPRAVVLFALVLVATGLSAPAALGGATLKLSDGRVLEGTDVRREGDLFILEVEGGSVIPLPASLVVEVGLTEAPEVPAEEIPPGLTIAGPQALAGKPAELTVTGPQVLAGTRIDAPQTHEQLAVFGEPAQFRRDAVVSNMGPSYWVPDPAQHNWAPSTWSDSPIDPTWEPESGLDMEDALADSRSTFSDGVIDSNWAPTDGFAKSKTWP
jgi:hypothetical protein